MTTVFTMRRYAQARSLLSPGVSLYSRWWIVSTWLKILSNFFFVLVAHHFSFWPQRRYPIPRGTPSVGALNTRGWGKFAILE